MTVQPLGGRGWWWWWRVKEEGEGALNYNIQISTELSAITGTAYVSGDGGRQPRPLTGGPFGVASSYSDGVSSTASAGIHERFTPGVTGKVARSLSPRTRVTFSGHQSEGNLKLALTFAKP